MGWPWVVGTHSWLEPTAWAVLSLYAAGKKDHERVDEAVRLLVDRILPDGGCNYGNTVVLDQVLRPHVEPTGLVMLALADKDIKDQRIERSLDYLQAQIQPRQGTASLCYACFGLAAHGQLPTGWQKHLTASARRTLSRDASPHKIALLALAALGSTCPLIPRSGVLAGGQV